MPAESRGSGKKGGKLGTQRPGWGQGKPNRTPGATVTTRPHSTSHAHVVWEHLERAEAERSVQAGWVSDVQHAVQGHAKVPTRPGSLSRPQSGAARKVQHQQKRPATAPAPVRGRPAVAAAKLRRTPGIDSDSRSSSCVSSSTSEAGSESKIGDDSDNDSPRTRGGGGEGRSAVARPTKHVTIVTRVENRDPDARVRALAGAPRVRAAACSASAVLVHITSAFSDAICAPSCGPSFTIEFPFPPVPEAIPRPRPGPAPRSGDHADAGGAAARAEAPPAREREP